MTRYYYTDPLAAAFMAKHFGMKFVDDIGLYDNPDDWVDIDMFLQGEWLVHPESLHLLEPQVGDFIYGLYKVGSLGTLIGQEILPGNEDSAKTFISRGVKIIQRNGIPFHWPEVEEHDLNQ